MTIAAETQLSRFGDVERLVEQVARCSTTASTYYNQQFPHEAVAPSELIGRWAEVPVTTKADLLEDQLTQPPYGSRLLAPVAELHLVVESSGSTSGVKEVHALTFADEATVIDMMADAFRRTGLTSNDVVAVTLPLSTAGGGTKVYHTARAIGALTLRIGSVSTTEKVSELNRFGPTAVVATPAYLDRLAMACADAGKPAGQLGVRRLYVATQAVSAEWVRRTEATWNAKVFEWYGNASGFFAMTCAAGLLDDSGWGTLHWDPAFELLEVLDSHGQLVAHGQVGELVGTHLANSTAPLIRYRLGDEAEFVEPGRCSCGASLPGLRAGSIRRADGMVKFRGVSLWPSAVDRVLAEAAGIDSSWIVLRQDDAAVEIAELFVRPAGGEFDYTRLVEQLHQRTGVRFDVIVWPHEQPPPPCQAVTASGKSPRWVDARQIGATSSDNSQSEGANK